MRVETVRSEMKFGVTESMHDEWNCLGREGEKDNRFGQSKL